MQVTARNITHQRVMKVEETQKIQSAGDATKVQLIASIVSEFGLGLRGRIEKYGLKRFIENTARVCVDGLLLEPKRNASCATDAARKNHLLMLSLSTRVSLPFRSVTPR